MDFDLLYPLDLLNLKGLRQSDIDQNSLDQAIEFCKSSDFDQAIELLKPQLIKNSKNPDLLNMIGALYLQLRNPNVAEQYLNRAVPFAPHCMYLINNRACVFLLRKDPVKAHQVLMAGVKNGLVHWPEYFYNLALCSWRMGDPKSARSYLNRDNSVRELKESVLLLAILNVESGAVDQAITDLKDCVNNYPSFLSAHGYLGMYLSFSGDLANASAHILKMIHQNMDDASCRTLWINVFQHVRFKSFKPDIVEVLNRVLSYPGGNVDYLTAVWENQLTYWVVFDSLPEINYLTPSTKIENFLTEILKAGISDDLLYQSGFNLLCLGLERLINRSYVFEILFKKIRAIFLNRLCVQESGLSDIERRFLKALAVQNWSNEYVYDVTPDEQKSCDQAIVYIKAQIKKNNIPVDLILSVLCYRPLLSILDLKSAQNLAGHNVLGFFVKTQVMEVMREQVLAEKGIPSLTSIQDGVSKQVEQMYMENPYPRWSGVNFSGSTNYLSLAPRKADRIQMLIAGCGTGRHALYVGLGYRNTQVTAIDLSRRSLAYAKRKTDEMDIKHIDYIQADILELGDWDRRFDAIESSGVLHHLSDPLKGLDILLKLLKPGGTIKLGLYSEIARQAIVAARLDIAKRGVRPDVESIQSYRAEIIQAGPDHPLRGLLHRSDFYTLSTCRDLIFHVQETRYTIPQIAQILADRRLIFQGFNLDQVAMSQFKKAYPHEGALYDLQAWHDYEQKHTQTFQGMYQFWAKKSF